MYFGWRILPSNYPLYKHWKDDLSQITNWIHKWVSHDEFIHLNLFNTVNSKCNKFTLVDYELSISSYSYSAADVTVPGTRSVCSYEDGL